MSEPDPEKWGFAGRNRANWGMYCRESPETVFVENNQLVIRSGLNTAESDSVKYQTGCINTKDKFSFRYGKVEVHAKLSAGKGSWPDRKSTRLNSSHVAISYAVFCLKKKKKKEGQSAVRT